MSGIKVQLSGNATATGGHEEFTYGEVASLAHMNQSHQKSNRGVTIHKVFENDTATPMTSTFTAEASDHVYRTSVVAPDLTQTDNFMYRGHFLPCNYSNNDEWNTNGLRWGYDNVLAGRTYETRTYSSDDQLIERTFTRYATTQAGMGSPTPSPIPIVLYPTPTKTLQVNARVASTQTIIYHDGEALSAVTKFTYDLPDDYGSPLNVKEKFEYAYLPVSVGTLPTPGEAPPTDVVNLADPSTGALVRKTVMTYQNAQAYKDKNILRLPIEVLVKNASDAIVAKTQIGYDGLALLDDYSGTVPGWSDPNTNVRGLVTSSTTWHDIAANQYVTTQAQYNAFGSPRKIWDGKGNLSQIEYADKFSDSIDRNTFAYPTKTISPVPDVNGIYGANESLVTETSYDYDSGLTKTEKNLNIIANQSDDAVTAMEYVDAMLRPTKVIAPNGHQTITEYGAGTDASSRWVKVKSQIDANNWKEDYSWFDGMGRAVKSHSVDDDGDVFVETQYDSMGRAWKTTNPYRSGDAILWTTSTFDTAGRPWKVTTPDNAVVEAIFGLSASGEIGTVVTVKDQALKERRSITNALGHLKRVDEPSGTSGLGAINSPYQPTSYGYDILNNLISVSQIGDTPAECGGSTSNCNQSRSFTYDAMSRLKSAANPESGTINYTYDANGNLLAKTDARPITTTYAYDSLNRVKTRSYGDGVTPQVSYFYDNVTNGKGKLIKVSSSISTTEYTNFDILGRVTAHKQTTDGTSYTTGYIYNLAGGLVEETYPSGRVVKNIVDNSGDLSMVESKKNGNAGFWSYANSFTYNPAGAVTSMQLGNGRWESVQFNSRLQPTKIALGTTPGATDKLLLNYGYGSTNNNGNVLTQDITVMRSGQSPLVFNHIYTYDELNRIKSAEEKTGSTTNWKQVYRFDRYGNRNFDTGTTFPTVLNAVTNPSVNPANNKFNTGQGYSYDSAGNVTADANGQTYVYDAENKQVSASNTGGLIGQYYFDGDGKRIKKYVPASGEITVFVYDVGGRLVAEYSTNVVPAGSAQVQYLTNDNLGTPRIDTDANGAITSRTDYMPYGEEINALGGRGGTDKYVADDVRQGFTGYINDGETGLDFAQARMYSNRLGRFLSVDPLLPSAKRDQPQSWNRFIYVLNNPLRYIDPNGEDYEDLTEKQKKLIDDWAATQNKANKTEISAQKMYDAIGEDQRATFEANANALENTTIIGKDGSKTNGLDIIKSVNFIRGETPVSKDNPQRFRLIVELKDGMRDLIKNAQNFESVRGHKGFPDSRQQEGGVPGLQISMSKDGKTADIDVDYETKSILKNVGKILTGQGCDHCKPENSDVRHSNHFEKHNSRFGTGSAGQLRRRYEPKQPK